MIRGNGVKVGDMRGVIVEFGEGETVRTGVRVIVRLKDGVSVGV